MKLVMISDTHEMHRKIKIPKCDLLLHAGDITGRGSLGKLTDFNNWLSELIEDGTIGDAVYIAGNHDLSLETNRKAAEATLMAGHYLNNSSAFVGPNGTFEVYGVPEQLAFLNWAFNTTEKGLTEKFDAVPGQVDVLVTHGPPYGILDENSQGIKCGSKALLAYIHEREPKLVVCGHIHEGHGIARVGNTLVVNASTCNAAYQPLNQPILLEL